MKRVILLLLIIGLMMPAAVLPVTAVDLDPGGGGGSGGGGVYRVKNYDATYTLTWDFKDALGKTRTTWMSITILSLKLEYYDSTGGGLITKWTLSFKFNWDTYWLSANMGEPGIRWGDDVMTDFWAHSYILGTDLYRDYTYTVSRTVSEAYYTWPQPYAYFYLEVNCGQTTTWYEWTLFFKIPTETGNWYLYNVRYDTCDWGKFLDLLLDVYDF